MAGTPAAFDIGKRFGRLVVVGVGPPRNGRAVVTATCDCGGKFVGGITELRTGHTKSCGCLIITTSSKNNLTHGLSRAREYNIWCGMKRRCHNTKDVQYPMYGGRGIEVCLRWRSSFEDFLKDMGNCPSPKHSIDRWPDRLGSYEPSNCRWATSIEQNRNRVAQSLIEYKGESKQVKVWCEDLGLMENYYAIVARLSRGWCAEDVFETPFKKVNVGVLIRYKGKERTATEWARFLGINLTTFLYRLKKGWPLHAVMQPHLLR